MTTPPEPGTANPAFDVLLRDLLENILKHADNPGACASLVTSQIRELIGVRLVVLASLDGTTAPALVGVCPPRLEADWNRPDIQRFMAAVSNWSEPRFIDPATGLDQGDLGGAGIGPSFVIPLWAGSERVGLLVLIGLMDPAGSRVILDALTRVSSVIGLILRNSFLYKNLERNVEARTAALEFQVRMAAIFLTCPDDEMFGEVLTVVLEAMRSPTGVFGYLDEDGAVVVPTLTMPLADLCDVVQRPVRFPRDTWGDSSWPRAIREKCPVWSNEPSTDLPEGHVGILRHVSLPILLHGDVIGLFQVANKDDDYTAADIRALEAIAGHVAPILGERLQRTRAQESLRRRDERHRAVLDTAMDGFWITDVDARLLEVNQTYARMSGYHVDELLAMRVPDLEAAETPAETAARMQKLIALGADRFESRHRRKDGSTYDVEVSIQYRPAEGGRCVVFVRDITTQRRAAEERAKLEDQLRHAQKVEAIGRLAGGVAHDFNNLTAIVLGYGEMLLEQLEPAAVARTWAEQIVEAGRRSSALTSQLLAFSRKQVLQPEVLDINALLWNLEHMLGRLIGEDIQLTFELAADVGCVTADPGQIEQVVTNLVVNARDAMPHGGILRVDTADVALDAVRVLGHEAVPPGRYVSIALTDTGVGMDEATLARVFEPFFTTKPKGKGTGLGLATVYGIVKQSGGYVHVRSDQGAGTTFTIYLPWTDARPGTRAVDSEDELPRGRGERILLVDDEAPIRRLCETFLSRLGYDVMVADSGPAALHLVDERGFLPDLLLTDVVMPGMGGTELGGRMREVWHDLKVLYMSGYPDDALASRGAIVPGATVLQKPFTERALAKRVWELLHAARLDT